MKQIKKFINPPYGAGTGYYTVTARVERAGNSLDNICPHVAPLDAARTAQRAVPTV